MVSTFELNVEFYYFITAALFVADFLRSKRKKETTNECAEISCAYQMHFLLKKHIC